MKNILIIFMILLLTFIIYLNYSSKNSFRHDTTRLSIKENNKKNISYNNATINTHTIDKDKNKTNQEIEESYTQNKSYSIFEEIDIDGVRLALKPIEEVTPLAAFHMKQNTIKEIELGDTILLPSIDGNSYKLLITHKEVSPRGNVSIDGSFSEEGITYTAILTEGSHAAFISMNTPEGTYEIELLNGIGYAYMSNDINKAKIDYSKSDEVYER